MVQKILVLNSKGGCGKSTIATNLAGFFASKEIHAALMDYDPQRSSVQWHSLRSPERFPIDMIDAAKQRSGVTRTWQTAVPPAIEKLIIDVPAGVNGIMLQDLVKRTDVILVPVAPSPIDIHATSVFIRDLLLVGKVRKFGVHVGVVANRVRRETPNYEPLKRFLGTLNIPFITSLHDSERYIEAAELGMGIHELAESDTTLEREQWLPLIRWLAYPTDNMEILHKTERGHLNLVSSKKTSFGG